MTACLAPRKDAGTALDVEELEPGWELLCVDFSGCGRT